MGTKREDLKTNLQTQAQGGQVQQQKPNAAAGLKALMAQDSVKKRFDEVLKNRAPQFMASIINLVNTSPELQNVDGMTVIQSAMVAAALDLPVDKNLGYMWIVPYGGKAQPQMGYRGYIQLALRTGQYKFINVIDVYEGEVKSWNRLSEELVLDFDEKKSDAIIGYAAYFELLNGFKKQVYWTKDQVEKHRQKFSKTDFGWKRDWDAMARKTVLKSMLSRWGILSIEIQKALVEDEREEVGEPIQVDEAYDITSTTTVVDGEIINATETN